jgi:hypothetical protein
VRKEPFGRMKGNGAEEVKGAALAVAGYPYSKGRL